MADEQAPPPPEQQPQEQQFYRQYLQSTAPDGSTTIREIVSPTLLDHDTAAAHERDAGYTFTGFVDPAKMQGVPPAQAAPAPPPEDAAPLPSAVVPTSGTVPTAYSSYVPPTGGPWQQWNEATPDAVARPDSSPWYNLIPPALATAGPLALSIAEPQIGIPLWLASGATAALGGATGEGIREKLAGEELSPRNIATQGAVSGATDIGMNTVVTPYVLKPIARGITGRLGAVGTAAEDLGPVLTTRESTVTAPAASAPPPPFRTTSLHTIDLANSTPAKMNVLAAQATDAERPALAGAWVAARRAEALTSGNPVQYMRDAYNGLAPETQQALFGAGKGAYERMINTAWGGTSEEMKQLGMEAVLGGSGYTGHVYGVPFRIPGAAMTRAAADITAPFAAKGMLMSPSAARFGANLSGFTGVAGPAAANLAAQAVAERARQAGLPTP